MAKINSASPSQYFSRNSVLSYVQNGCSKFELNGLNVAGCIPYIRESISAPIRLAYSIVLIGTALAEIIFRICIALTKENDKEKQLALVSEGFELLTHGIANYIRAKIEMYSLYTLPLCLIYDFYLYRCIYPGEKGNIGWFPTRYVELKYTIRRPEPLNPNVTVRRGGTS